MPRNTAYQQDPQAYDVWFTDNQDILTAELDTVRAFLPEGIGLEIGCGTGNFLIPLGISIGLDPALPMLQRARDKGHERLIQGRAEQLPFADNSFDYALFVTSLCFVDSIPLSLGEACRTVRDGGAIIVAFLNADSELGRKYEKRKEESRFYRDAEFINYSRLKDELRQHNAEIIDCLQTQIPEQPLSIETGHDEGGFVVCHAQVRKN